VLEPGELADVLDRRAERLAAALAANAVAEAVQGLPRIPTWSCQELMAFAEAQER
jgi:hypothetical protein